MTGRDALDGYDRRRRRRRKRRRRRHTLLRFASLLSFLHSLPYSLRFASPLPSIGIRYFSLRFARLLPTFLPYSLRPIPLNPYLKSFQLSIPRNGRLVGYQVRGIRKTVPYRYLRYREGILTIESYLIGGLDARPGVSVKIQILARVLPPCVQIAFCTLRKGRLG